MEHSIALVTGATSGLGHAAARALAEHGWREIIVTGRSLSGAKEAAARLATETRKEVFTPLALDLDKPSSVQAALAELVNRARPIDFLKKKNIPEQVAFEIVQKIILPFAEVGKGYSAVTERSEKVAPG